MLDTLTLECFQAHTKLKIDFAPTITTIMGPTDVGKSSILRALRWLCLDDLSGDAFVQDGAKQTTITLEVDGKQIQRIKSTSSRQINIYALGEKIYKNPGLDMPATIGELLNVSPINFQAQHDSPFWFGISAGEVSRRLNAVIDLSLIDSALAAIAAKARRVQEKVILTTERLEVAQKELAALAPQAERVKDFEEIKQRHEQLQKHKEDLSNLGTRLENIASYSEEEHHCAEQAEQGQAVVSAALAARAAQKQCNALNQLVTTALSSSAAATAPPDLAPLNLLYNRWSHTKDEVTELSRLVNTAQDQQSACLSKQRLAEQVEKDFHKEIKGQRCPICQRPMS